MKKEGKNEKRKRRKNKGQIKQKGHIIKKRNAELDWRSVLIHLRIQNNIKGKRKEKQRKKETKEYDNQIQVKHINGTQN